MRITLEEKSYIEVVEYETDKVVHTVDVSDKSPRQAEKIQEGMDRNLNHEKFYMRIVTPFKRTSAALGKE